MNSKGFSDIEKDAIGEILNISLGASATAASTMLNARVDITTPIVNVVSKDEFEFSNIEPAVAVEITYVSGLEGSNIMLLKKWDVKVIVEMLMGMEIADEDFELDEMNISAICEVMNQMMGASSTALSEFLNRMVNISPPISFEMKDEESFRNKCFSPEDDLLVVIGFTLKIGDRLESEFLNVMKPALAKELVSGFFPDGVDVEEPELVVDEAEPEESGSTMLTQEEIEQLIAASNQPAEEAETVQPEPAPQVSQTVQPEPQTQPVGGLESPVVSQPAPQVMMQPVQPATGIDMSAQIALQQQMLQMMQQMQQMQESMQHQQQIKQQKPDPKTIKAHPAIQPTLNPEDVIEGAQEENMEMILGVPLEISVEIGRTKKLVKDILDFSKGSLVVLDKAAGEQVDLYVNGRCIAKGDVVVVDDNFGIRVTEIIKKNVVTE